MNAQEVLNKCTVEGLVIKLPEQQLERKTYQEVAKSLQLIGGKWTGGKTSGFVFKEDPTDLLDQIRSGDKVNLKKEFQFFETPSSLADRLVELACIEEDHHVLEPSAGQGSIVKAVNRKFPNKSVHVYELMPLNASILNKIKTVRFCGNCFLTQKLESVGLFDRIIANPPFSKNQDIDHIREMYNQLKKGGRIVSIASKHWQFAQGKKEQNFRTWLDSVQATVKEVDSGEFKQSGTTIATVIIIIDK